VVGPGSVTRQTKVDDVAMGFFELSLVCDASCGTYARYADVRADLLGEGG
jgi:hypothetical protein